MKHRIGYFLFAINVILCSIIIAKKEICFQPLFLNWNWTDSPPRYLFFVNFSNRGTFTMRTTLMEDIVIPINRLKLTQMDDSTKKQTLIYNVTKTDCEFMSMVNHVPMFRILVNRIFQHGNYTFDCPWKKGLYVIENLAVRSRNPIFGLIYNPKKTLTLSGGISEQLPDNSVHDLGSFKVQLKILKKSCDFQSA